MTGYFDFINNNKDRVDIKIIQSIDDKTMKVSFFRQSNIFCDGVNFYLGKDHNSVEIKNKRQLRLFLSQIRGKMKLQATDNSMGYTRLIYKVYLK